MFLLGAGYVAGLLIALKFNRKSPETLQKDFASSEDRYSTIGKNLLDIHRNLFETFEESIFSPENKKRVAEYKERLLVEIDMFQKEGEMKLEEWKKKGFEKKDELEANLRDIYDRRMEFLEQAKQKGLELLEETNEKGSDMMEEGKIMALKMFEQAKKQLSATYADMKEKISKKK